MFHSYVLSSILTLSLTYSWYSFNSFWNEEAKDGIRPKRTPHIPAYMWDIYRKGMNISEVDVVKGVFPKFQGLSHKSWSYRNHRKKELQYDLPRSQHEKLVKAEIRMMTDKIKTCKISYQVYVKTDQWKFLDEKKVTTVNTDWISLEVTQSIKTAKQSVKYLILTLVQEPETKCCEPLHPVLLLSYYTDDHSRKKRSLVEDYEEKTNNIWKEHFVSKKLRSSCRRKPLYIKFSEIDYDSWIVAPEGYEAFQCVGKCTFPVSEHLSPTKHAILQTLLHNISPSKAPRACCVPTKLEPISVLYIDGNGVLTYRFRYHDMVVAECGCR